MRSHKKKPSLDKPKWIENEKWEDTFKHCYLEGKALQWREVCYIIENNFDWTQDCGNSQIDSDQLIVESRWNLVMLKTLWTFREAFKVALLVIPEG